MTSTPPPLTLEMLAGRLDALEQANAQLERENQQLRARVARIDGGEGRSTALQGHERMSRRWMLRRAAQATAATVVAGALLQREIPEADADHASGTLIIASVDTHHVRSENKSDFLAINAINNSGSWPTIAAANSGSSRGIEGWSGGGTGIRGTGRIGVHGKSELAGYGAVYGENTASEGYGVVADAEGTDSAAVLGRNPEGDAIRGEGKVGVHGVSSVGHGVVGDGAGSGMAGVLGRHSLGLGVVGTGVTGVKGEGQTGVMGVSGIANGTGVLGFHSSGEGHGVSGNSVGTTFAGLYGYNHAGDAVRGEGKTGVRGISPNSCGVFGAGGTGYGGIFSGTRSQLRLTPTGRIGRPTTGYHQIGELYLDKVGSLFICSVAGTPGTWRRVSSTNT